MKRSSSEASDCAGRLLMIVVLLFLGYLSGVIAPKQHQPQRRKPAQQSMGDERCRFREGQREFMIGTTLHRPRQFRAERNRERHRAAVAAGPGIGVGTEAMDARQEVG